MPLNGNEITKTTPLTTIGNNGARIISAIKPSRTYNSFLPSADTQPLPPNPPGSLDGSRPPVCLLSITPRLYVMPSVTNFSRNIVTSPTSVEFAVVAPVVPPLRYCLIFLLAYKIQFDFLCKTRYNMIKYYLLLREQNEYFNRTKQNEQNPY